jgi:hypothetical protein
MAVGDADDGFLEIAVTESNSAQHGPIGRACDTCGDQLAACIERHENSPFKASATAGGR